MFVFKSALPSFCGLLAMTAMACVGDDSTATGSQDITSAPSDGASYAPYQGHRGLTS